MTAKYTCYEMCQLVLKGINKGHIQNQTLIVTANNEMDLFDLKELLTETINDEEQKSIQHR
jgi:hypothetical protein